MNLTWHESTDLFSVLSWVAQCGNPAPIAEVHECAGLRRLCEEYFKLDQDLVVQMLVDAGDLIEVRNRGGRLLAYRFSVDAANKIVEATAGGCTDKEIEEAPEWIRDRIGR